MNFRLSLAAFAIAAAAFGTAEAQTAPRPPFTVEIVGFNDYHGNLETPGSFGVNTLVPTASRPAVCGAEYMAAYVARMKSSNPLNVVVGPGDFIGATPLISVLFFDEPSVETLNKIGLEFNAVGNHEFDKGKDVLRRLQNGGCKSISGAPDPNSCKGLDSTMPGMFDGARYKWLSANVVESATGHTLLPPYGLKTFNGVKVAFIGMTLKGTPGIVTPTGVGGPLNAGSFGSNTLDATFGPQVVFAKAPPDGQVNLSPYAGLQFFGEVNIDARSAELSVDLRDIGGQSVFTRTLAPSFG